MKHPAFELYAGDSGAVRAACADGRLDDLRSGKVTPYRVLFPKPFTASDVLLVEKAVEAITGASEPLEFHRTEIEGGLFVDKIVAPWVASVAAVGSAGACVLQTQWSRAYEAQEKENPEWSKADHAALMAQFIHVCRTAWNDGLDLLMVWLL